MGAAIAAVALVGACKGYGGAGAGRLSIAARTVAPAGATAAAAPAGGLDLGGGVVLTRVRLAVQRIALEGGSAGAMGEAITATPNDRGSGGGGGDDGGSGGDDGGGSGSAGGSDDGGSDEVSVGPFAVDLGADALAGGIRSVFDSDVPAGSYRELRIVIGPVADAAAGTALADLGGRSLVIDGTIDGAPFTFSSALAATRKIEMAVEVAADGSSSGVTLTIDPHGWFRAPDGTRLDPTLDASRAAIEDEIRASIGAELDDDHGGGGDDGAGHA